jgi:hypothetical protein
VQKKPTHGLVAGAGLGGRWNYYYHDDNEQRKKRRKVVEDTTEEDIEKIVDKKVSSIVPNEVKRKLRIMVPSIMLALNIWFEGGQIGPNPIKEYLNSGDEDFSIEDILTRITLPIDAKLARTCDIIVVNP